MASDSEEEGSVEKYEEIIEISNWADNRNLKIRTKLPLIIKLLIFDCSLNSIAPKQSYILK